MSKFHATRQSYNDHPEEYADKFERIPEVDQLKQFIAMLKPGSLVLDLGCGSGRDASYLTDAGLRVIGTDLSAGLIREAQKRHQGIDFRVMDMSELGFADATFDGVWSKLAILHVEREQLPEILRSVYRKLKPGGVIFIETKNGEGEGYEKVSFAPSEQRYFIYYTTDELKRLLQDAGFVGVEGYEYTVGNEHATLKKDRSVVYGKRPE